MPFFDQNQQGRIINRLSNDTFAIDDEIPFNASIFMEFLLRSIGYPIAIMYINYKT
jgi:ABC-type multidrug transport system fused ATPase/permease subunit